MEQILVALSTVVILPLAVAPRPVIPETIRKMILLQMTGDPGSRGIIQHNAALVMRGPPFTLNILSSHCLDTGNFPVKQMLAVLYNAAHRAHLAAITVAPEAWDIVTDQGGGQRVEILVSIQKQL